MFDSFSLVKVATRPSVDIILLTWSLDLVRVDTRSGCRSTLVASADPHSYVDIGRLGLAADSLVTASDHFRTPRGQAAFRMQLAF